MPKKTHPYDLESIKEHLTLTETQKIYYDTLIECGSIRQTAKMLGKSRSTVRNTFELMQRKLLRIEVNNKIPDEQLLQGTSTLYRTNEDTGQQEKVLQWVKTKEGKETELKALKAVTEKLAKAVEGKAKPIDKPMTFINLDLLAVYVGTDLHLGQYSWSKESGKDVDLDTVQNNAVKAMRLLIETTPNASDCLVVDLGDTLHSSNDDSRTKSGHSLDTDTRHAKVYQVLIDMKIEMISLALSKHENVKYIIVAGNHSDLVPHYLTAMLSAYYRNEPRFSIDTSPAIHKYHRHGKTLLGFHHGHATKMARLPEVMVWDRKADISTTDYRYWLTGHLHKDTVLDNPISRVESFRNLTPNDAWATGAGYRGHKQATAITYSKLYGEIARNVVPIALAIEAL